ARLAAAPLYAPRDVPAAGRRRLPARGGPAGRPGRRRAVAAAVVVRPAAGVWLPRRRPATGLTARLLPPATGRIGPRSRVSAGGTGEWLLWYIRNFPHLPRPSLA